MNFKASLETNEYRIVSKSATLLQNVTALHVIALVMFSGDNYKSDNFKKQ